MHSGVTAQNLTGYSRYMTNSQPEIFRVHGLPVLQNRLFLKEEEARGCPVGDVVLRIDPVTSIIHNAAFDSQRVIYDHEYNNEQAASSSFRAHLDYVADLVRCSFEKDDIIEVGCGKGVFIEYLRRRGFAVTGLDPTYEGVDPAIQKRFFRSGIGLHANGIVLRHVLEHIENPIGFLKSIADANNGQGKIYIEVPCFDWICENRAWYDVFYEHVNYFRVGDFERIFGKIFHIERTFSGQYISIIADLGSMVGTSESVSTGIGFPDFSGEVTRFSDEIARWRSASGRKVAIWGAGSKGVIFAVHMSRASAKIDYVIDINVDKIGRYLPCTGIEVVSPERFLVLAERNTRIFVMNPNYLNEIKGLAGSSFDYVCL